MDVLTICAVNYLPFARILANTFLTHNSESKFFLLLVDGDCYPLNLDLDPRILVLKPSDLDLDSETFQRMTVYYDVTELCTALKALGLKYLLDQGSEIAVYLDPDIAVFENLNEISDFLTAADIVLTPHTLHEIPRDGLRPSERDIMSAGTFNLGFIGVKNSKSSFEFLSWWNQRLTFDAISAISENLFTDQRWIDFVPSYFSFAVIRHFGFNVAYWNLHERNLVRTDKTIIVNNQPLKFLHFSGYRPDRPWIASKYVEDKPRVVMSRYPEFKELAREYGETAIKFGWNSEDQFEYGYSTVQGIHLTAQQRRNYRGITLRASSGQCVFPPLPEENSRFREFFLGARTAEAGRLSGALYRVWKSRADLQTAFPDAAKFQAEDFVTWAYHHGMSEAGLTDEDIYLYSEDEVFVPEVTQTKRLLSDTGVNLVGYYNEVHGVGQFGRIVANSVISTNLPYTIIPVGIASESDYGFSGVTGAEAYYPFTIANINSDQFPTFIGSLPKEFKSHSKFVGVWAWELEEFPTNFHASIELVHEIWAMSTFMRDAIQPHTEKLVTVFPAPIQAPKIIHDLDSDAIGIPKNRPYNLFIFDYRSVFERKNPLDLVAAHKLAFPDGFGPNLIIKTSNAAVFPSQHEELLFSASGRNDIIFLDRYLSKDQLYSLINECDVYISLHRSEGYGLTMAEAMSLGKPVIATGYSGNLDFMDETNSILVPYELVPVGPGVDPYSPSSLWAQPDVEIAANAMRKLFLNNDLKESIGEKARSETTIKFSPQRASSFVVERLIQIQHQGNYGDGVISKLSRVFTNWKRKSL